MASIILKQDYETEQRIRAQYKAADAQNDTEGVAAARAAIRAHMKQVSAKGDSYERVYRLYCEAMERGNQHIDLREVIWDSHVAGLIQSFREYGIEHFTFSSTWSSSVETAWLFAKNGCALEGLLEINGPHQAFGSEEYEKVPAYLFAVK